MSLALVASALLTLATSLTVRAQAPGPSAGRRPLVVGLPDLESNERGELVVHSHVRVTGAEEGAQLARGAPALGPSAAGPAPASAPEATDSSNPFRLIGDWFQREAPPAAASPADNGGGPQLSLDDVLDVEPNLQPIPSEELPPGQPWDESTLVAEPLFEQVLSGSPPPGRMGRRHRIMQLMRGPAVHRCEPGIGRERVIYAPMFIDISQPLNNFRFRLQSAYNTPVPDRVEYFWAKSRADSGRGPPLLERQVDWQEFRILMEAGGPKFSAATELPFRAVDPDFNNNTAGLSDVNVTTKLVLVDGKSIQITQLFRSYFNSGLSTRGLGTGHVSMEPGFLLRYQQNPLTFWHSELKFWFPIAGDPNQAGPLLQTGLGLSHVWHETDSFAVLPTFEVQHWTVLNGMQTVFPVPVPEEVDGMQIWNLAPGVRLVFDRPGELGLFELGIGSSFAVSGNRWYDSLLRFDLRFSF